LTFSIKGLVWRTSQQVRFLRPWARHLMGCLYVCVVKHVATDGRWTRIPHKGHFSARASAEKFPWGPTEKIKVNSKNDRKIALLSLFQRGGGNGKRPKITVGKKKTKNSTNLLYLHHV